MKNIQTRPVAVLGGLRSPFCRMGTALSGIPVLDLMKQVMKATVDKYALKDQVIGEVALGTVFYPPSEWNFAREAVMASGLSHQTPALFVQRACATSLDAAITVANKIALGKIESGIVGGAESMSTLLLYLPQKFSKRMVVASRARSLGERLAAFKGFSFSEIKPKGPGAVEPTSKKSMGEHCEMMAKEWKIARADQDALSFMSHQNGVAAYQRGFYKGLIHPTNGVDKDNPLRADTSIEKLAKLKPVFDPTPEGTLTAGNSSPLTDGASTCILASEAWAKERGLPVLAYLTDYECSAIDFRNEGLLLAPAYAVPKILDRNRMKLQDFDIYDIHEAFAAQVLCTLKAWESASFCKEKLKKETPLGSIDRKKMNLAGGSVSLGHPFGATGTRLLTTVAKLLEEKGSGKALLSICTGGGMGTAAVLER